MITDGSDQSPLQLIVGVMDTGTLMKGKEANK